MVSLAPVHWLCHHITHSCSAPVNFLGSNDEYVASGSDDGLFFLWDKSTAEIKGIWEGDESVVNCIESHPSLPVVAVSGIDDTVKLFAPDRPDDSELRLSLGNAVGDYQNYLFPSASRLKDLESIIARNADPRERLRQSQRLRLEDLAVHLGIPSDRLNSSDCTIQVSNVLTCPYVPIVEIIYSYYSDDCWLCV